MVPPCEPHVFFTIRFTKPVDLFVPNSYYVDGPGGDMQVWIKRIHLVRLHVELEKEVSTDFNIQNFVAHVRKDLRPLVEQEHAVEAGHQYTAHIDKGMIGHLRYRVFGIRLGFDQWRIYHNCGRLRINSGTAVLPTVREGWMFWQTKGWPKTSGGGGGRRARQNRPSGTLTSRRPTLTRELTAGHRGTLTRHTGGGITGRSGSDTAGSSR